MAAARCPLPGGFNPFRRRARARSETKSRPRPTCRLFVELLEDRTLPSGGVLAPSGGPPRHDTFATAALVGLNAVTAGTVAPQDVEYFQLKIPASGDLTAQVHAQGFRTSLALYQLDPRTAPDDLRGLPLIQSDGQSVTNPDDLISQYLDTGSGVFTYYLEVVGLQGGAGPFTLTTSFSSSLYPNRPPTNPVGDDPQAVVVADFTNDGILGFATANAGSNDVTVYRGLGEGNAFNLSLTPANEPSYRVGQRPVALVAADFNGDGRLDLATADQASGTVSILLGLGNSKFTRALHFTAGAAPTALVAGDFTGDGHVDLAVADESSNRVAILWGNGDGTFQAPLSYAVGMAPASLVAGDFTGNGLLDLAVADQGSNDVSVLLNLGHGTFAPARHFAAGLSPHSLVAADFNGDGRLDLAVINPSANGPNTISVLRGNGDGTFQGPAVLNPRTIPLPTGADLLVAGDFSGDGTPDLVTAAGDTGVLLKGNGDGTFQDPLQTFAVNSPNAGAAGAFDRTGTLDLAFANATDNVSILDNLGAGSFQPPIAVSQGAQPTPLFADWPGDPAPDAVILSRGTNILFRQGLGAGSFAPPVLVNPGAPVRDVAVVSGTQGTLIAGIDLNGNSVSLFTRVRRADGSVGFVRTPADRTGLFTGPSPARIEAGDLTGNGLADLVVLNADNWTLSIFLGQPDGSFTPARPAPLFVGVDASGFTLADLEGDGQQDILIANRVASTARVVSYQGETFTVGLPFRAGGSLPSLLTPAQDKRVQGYAFLVSPDGTTQVATGDFNGDGIPDLVTIDKRASQLALLFGDGSGGFLNPVLIPTDPNPRAVRVADFDGDGIPDLAVLDSTIDGRSEIQIFRGNGNGTFQPPVSYDFDINLQGFTVVPDLLGQPGRNVFDLAAGDFQGDVLLLLGSPDGTFQPFQPPEPNVVAGKIALSVADLTGRPGETDFVLADQDHSNVMVQYGQPGQQLALTSSGLLKPEAVAVADLNGDGLPDLVVANSGGNDVLVYLGIGNGQFDPNPLAFPVGTDPVGLTVADLNGDGIPDVVTADEGSNDVAVLFGQGRGAGWTLTPGPRLQTGAGPVAVMAAPLHGPNAPLDLIVTNSMSNTVSVLPAVGLGFFADQRATVYDTGADPQQTVFGDFGGCAGLVTVNAGANNLTFDSMCGASDTVSSGGERPLDAVVGDFNHDGETDLLVINNEDGELALLEGGPDGLTLSRRFTLADVQHPTALALSDTGDIYVTEQGVESAILVTIPAAVSAPPAPPLPPPPFAQVPGLAPEDQIQLLGAATDRLPLLGADELSEDLAVNSFKGGEDPPAAPPPTAADEARLSRFVIGLEGPGIPEPALPVSRSDRAAPLEDSSPAPAALEELSSLEARMASLAPGAQGPTQATPSGKLWRATVDAEEAPQPLPAPRRLPLPDAAGKPLMEGASEQREGSRAGIWGAALVVLGLGWLSGSRGEAIRGPDPQARRRR